MKGNKTTHARFGLANLSMRPVHKCSYIIRVIELGLGWGGGPVGVSTTWLLHALLGCSWGHALLQPHVRRVQLGQLGTVRLSFLSVFHLNLIKKRKKRMGSHISVNNDIQQEPVDQHCDSPATEECREERHSFVGQTWDPCFSTFPIAPENNLYA